MRLLTGPRLSLVSASLNHPKVSFWASETCGRAWGCWGWTLKGLLTDFRAARSCRSQAESVSVAVLVFADNVDDPTGNFRSGPLTGWKVFLLLLCALLGIIVCAVVGAVVFQKRQERNKRFY